MSAFQDHRDTFDNYRGELFRQGDYRIVLCKGDIQWIIQCRKKGTGARWIAFGHRTTRKASIRLWTAEGCSLWDEFMAQPHKAREMGHG